MNFFLVFLFVGFVFSQSSYPPVIEIGDYDRNGIVTGLDTSEIASSKTTSGNPLFAIFDLDGDFDIDNDDKEIVNQQNFNNSLSSFNDQTIIKLFYDTINEYYYKDYLSQASIESLWNSGYYSNLIEFKWGIYWFNPAGIATNFDPSLVNFSQVQGFTIDSNGKIVSLVWGYNAIPFFQNSTGFIDIFDYFTCGPFIDGSFFGCEWMNYPVVQVSPPPIISQDPAEYWYTEYGYCLYEIAGVPHVDRALSYNECIFDTPIYDLNPRWINGSFPLPPLVWAPPTHLLHLSIFETPSTDGKFKIESLTIFQNGLDDDDMKYRVENQYGRSVPN